MNTRITSFRNRRGAAVIEFAMTVPLLFLFVFASIEFSRANMIKNMIENAAMEGAREGMLPGRSAADCIAASQELIDIMALNGATITVEPTTLTTTSPDVTVTVTVPMSQNSLPMSRFVLGETLAQSVTLPREIQ
ncbi:MAG: TadE/TadG family type IV pilus assembly protein [Pirellulaceae bacterium]